MKQAQAVRLGLFWAAGGIAAYALWRLWRAPTLGSITDAEAAQNRDTLAYQLQHNPDFWI